MRYQLFGLLLGAIYFCTSLPASAALGDQLVTTSSSSGGRSAQTKTTTSVDATYTVTESETAGIKIRQFVNSQGRVFAITWKGTDLPPLEELLGTHLPEYRDKIAARGRIFGRKTLKIKTENIVVEGSSRQTDQRGRAYIPAILPEGFDLKDISFNE
ncbi:DUF2844 domain-containing protein [Bdellovibrio sp. HCB290]|uniref:DUF2844 domain-containing protein n=1 Tax=Bdellovibrio sp. HCB290 TaxID=3394356 RepID=UPI0039B3E800